MCAAFCLVSILKGMTLAVICVVFFNHKLHFEVIVFLGCRTYVTSVCEFLQDLKEHSVFNLCVCVQKNMFCH